MKNKTLKHIHLLATFLLIGLFTFNACLKENQFDPSQVLEGGGLHLNPPVAVVGQPFVFYAHIEVDSNTFVENATIWVKRMSDSGSPEIIMPLYDNGDYSIGDYAAGDFNYNGMIYSLVENEVDTVKYIATGNVLQNDGTYLEQELGYGYMSVFPYND